MGIRDRLKRAERVADEDTTALRCPVGGGVVRGEGAAALTPLVQGWRREIGPTFDPEPALERITTHRHKELAQAAFSDMPGVPAP